MNAKQKASLSSSFSPAPRSPTPSSSRTANTPAPVPASEEAKEERKIPGMDEWKTTLESYNTQWLAESSEARAKAEATRTRIESERAASSKSLSDASKAKRATEKAREEEMKRSERLREELSGSPGLRRSKGRHLNLGAQEERETKVKEAWEMVKGSSSAPAISSSSGSGVVHAGDARGVMPQDVTAGQALGPGQSRPSVKQVSHTLLSAKIRANGRPHTTLLHLANLFLPPCYHPLLRLPSLSPPSHRRSVATALLRKHGKRSHLPLRPLRTFRLLLANSSTYPTAPIGLVRA